MTQLDRRHFLIGAAAAGAAAVVLEPVDFAYADTGDQARTLTGTIAYGATIEEAYDRAQLLEWLAEVYWRARLAGTPRILDSAELAAVTEAARAHRYRGGGA